MTLLETLDQAEHSLFRYEYLQSFSLNAEKELRLTWEKEQRIAEEYMQTWWQYISTKKENGINMQRVSLIRKPLTPYKEMEIEIFRKTVPFGDDIRIITEDQIEKLNIPHQDFWIIDDAIVVDLRYSSQGEWLGFDTRPSTAQDISNKTNLLSHSTLLETFLR